MDDLVLFENYKKNNCEKSLLDLINRHEKLFYSVCQGYSTVFNERGIFFDDVLKDKYYVMYKAISSFNPDKKSKISTWIGNYARYHCLTIITKKSKTLNIIEGMDVPEDIAVEEFTDLAVVMPHVMNILSECSDKRIINVFKFRYDNGGKTPWNKVSKKLGVCDQTAINLHEKGLAFIRKRLKNKF